MILKLKIGFKRKQINIHVGEIQNEILKVMAMHVLRDVVAHIQAAPFFFPYWLMKQLPSPTRSRL